MPRLRHSPLQKWGGSGIALPPGSRNLVPQTEQVTPTVSLAKSISQARLQNRPRPVASLTVASSTAFPHCGHGGSFTTLTPSMDLRPELFHILGYPY